MLRIPLIVSWSIAFACVLHMAHAAATPQEQRPDTQTRQLLTDPVFARGVRVVAPNDPRTIDGLLQIDRAAGDPAWRLAQWSSRTTLSGAAPQKLSGGRTSFSSETKAVVFGPAEGDERGVRLLMLGGREYAGRLRRPEEPWPHLLVEQEVARPPALAELSRLQFRIDFRLLQSRVAVEGPLQPWHCAQFQAFLTVQNRNRGSAGHGDFLWFGIPMYDSRHRQPIAHAARDTAGSNKFIYTPAGRVYTPRPAADGDWITIDHDLLPLIREGLERAWKDGFLLESRNPADLRITSLNLGWELTGPLDVEMHFRDLSLEATADRR